MQSIEAFLPYIQIVLSILLVGGVLIQQSSATLGGAFGGDNWSASFHTRRGAEKFIFNGTIAVAVLFAAVSIVRLIVGV